MRIWLKRLRKKRGLTQLDIAKMANVDITTINKIELGERNPSVSTAKKIADVLDFDWVRFFEDEHTSLG